jgi:hypothetical protein
MNSVDIWEKFFENTQIAVSGMVELGMARHIRSGRILSLAVKYWQRILQTGWDELVTIITQSKEVLSIWKLGEKILE